MAIRGDFYEDDEPIEKIRSAWKAGKPAITAPPATQSGLGKTINITSGDLGLPQLDLGLIKRLADASLPTVTNGAARSREPVLDKPLVR